MANIIYQRNKRRFKQLPDINKTKHWTESVFQWLFSLGADYDDEMYHTAKGKELKQQLKELLLVVAGDEVCSDVYINEFFRKIENIHLKLEDDLETIFQNDPAAESVAEVLLAYPGFFAIAIYRIAHELWISKIPILPRLISEYVHGKTGIDIHPGAKIGERFFIDHGTGIVVGETSVIGHNVKLYQGVTLGALSVHKDYAEVKRHPTIGNNVTIYANATILGGETFIGDHSVIGGNVWLTNSVPSNSLVYHKSEISIKSKVVFPEPLNFVI